MNLPQQWFADKLDRHASQLRLLHYPAPDSDLESGQLRCGSHTDLGMMTILRNHAAEGGLQVKPRNGRWVDAPAIDDTFVVNIGDLLMRWTNDRWVSTLHRVVVPEGEDASKDRVSVPYFFQPSFGAVIETIPTTVDADHPLHYEPVVAGEWITAKSMAGLT